MEANQTNPPNLTRKRFLFCMLEEGLGCGSWRTKAGQGGEQKAGAGRGAERAPRTAPPHGQRGLAKGSQLPWE